MRNPHQYMTLFEFLRIKNPNGTTTTFHPGNNELFERILKHVMYEQQLREQLGHPIQILSCFRTVEHERSKGRTGTSQHTFLGQGWNGASDTRVQKIRNMSLDEHNRAQHRYAKLMLDSPAGIRPKRIAYYPNGRNISWFHKDWDERVSGGMPQLFVGMPDGSWERYQNVERWLNLIYTKSYPPK